MNVGYLPPSPCGSALRLSRIERAATPVLIEPLAVPVERATAHVDGELLAEYRHNEE